MRLVGRLTGVDGTRVAFGTTTCAASPSVADRRSWPLCSPASTTPSTGSGSRPRCSTPSPSPQCAPVPEPSTRSTSRAAGITTVVWATGHRRPYDWLDLPILDDRGEIAQYRGVTPLAGRLRARAAVPALPQLQLHRRRRPRRRVRRRPHLPHAPPSPRRRRPGDPRAESSMTMYSVQPPSTLTSGTYDVIVVGARAAGAATAMLLARAGLRTLAARPAAASGRTRSRPTR